MFGRAASDAGPCTWRPWLATPRFQSSAILRECGELPSEGWRGSFSGSDSDLLEIHIARPEADAGVQESLPAEQRELGNNLAERRVRSARSGKATGRDSVNATTSMRMDFLVGTAVERFDSEVLLNPFEQLNDILPINSPLLKLQSTTASILCVHTACRWSGYTNFTTKLTTSCGAPTAGRWRCRSG